DVAADDVGAAALVVAVVGDRRGAAAGGRAKDVERLGLGLRGGAMGALAHIPLKGVFALSRRDGIDLLPHLLADVADPQVSGLAVEGPTPRVAQTPQPDVLRGRIWIVMEWIVRGRLVGIAVVDVDAQQLGEACGQDAGRPVFPIRAAAVADPDVE